MPTASPQPAPLRSGAGVMSHARLGRSFPTALNFARSFMRQLVNGAWRLEKLRVDVDEMGRGELLFRLTDGRHTFHFFVMSNYFPPEQKIDRSYGINWDAASALCQGEWTEEREAYLRRELPKQRAGRLDYDTLGYTRGNRSERLFDHVVDCLAEGRQPDPLQLAAIGYIFRTTGFTANGFIGMRSFAGLGPDHPLRLPYHVQMCTAFLLREYVFELADTMAAKRSPKAVKLDPRFRRYLGIGNSAGLGMVTFLYNHPVMLHRWCAAQEGAIAEARRQPVSRGGRTLKGFRALAAKAVRYLTEDPREGHGIFRDYQALAEDVRRIGAWAAEYEERGTVAGRPAGDFWEAMLAVAGTALDPEATELLLTLMLESYPAIVDRFVETMDGADDRLHFDPAMPAAELLRLAEQAYAWLPEVLALSPEPDRYFWYYSEEAPFEPRRGRRGAAPEVQRESQLDLPSLLPALRGVLAGHPDTPVGEALAGHPELRNVAARVQTLHGLDYAELRHNTLCDEFSPFAVIRYVLTYYGMEKLDPQPPRSVKGSFLQGAPIAEDLGSGRMGDWPFPLIPAAIAVAEAPPAPRVVERADILPTAISRLMPWGTSEYPEDLVVSYVEVQRWTQRTLEAALIPLGPAIEAARALTFAEALEGRALAALLAQHAAGQLPHKAPLPREATPGRWRLDAAGGPAFGALPLLLDLAAAGARQHGTGIALMHGATGCTALEGFGIGTAEAGLVTLLAWPEAGGVRVALAMPDGADGPALLLDQAGGFQAIATLLPAELAPWLAEAEAEAGVLAICLREWPMPAGALRGAALRARRQGWHDRGVTVRRDEFEGVRQAAGGMLVPASYEPILRGRGTG